MEWGCLNSEAKCLCRVVVLLQRVIHGDSKIWTQLNSKRRLNTRQTVDCGVPSSLLALRVDLRRLRSKLSSIRLMFSSDTRKKSCAT